MAEATGLGERTIRRGCEQLLRGDGVKWLALLKHFSAVGPPGWTVIVLADRGLYAQ
ncbi:hypothetical protein [Candidatus Accumulibacter contiguus]|uniref:hypothetical protein n=1 Tax=Candidatus Accumulibacter contiguus TaxID=2954381 RepID=UPI002FC286CD